MTAMLPFIATGPGETAAGTTVSWTECMCARVGAFIFAAAAPRVVRLVLHFSCPFCRKKKKKKEGEESFYLQLWMRLKKGSPGLRCEK